MISIWFFFFRNVDTAVNIHTHTINNFSFMCFFLNQCKLPTISTKWNSVSSVNFCKSCQFLVSWNYVRYGILAATRSNIITVWDVMPCSSVYSIHAEDLEEPADKITCHLNQEYYNPHEIMFCQIRVLNLLNKAVTLLFFVITSKSNFIERTQTTHSQRVWSLSHLQVQAIPNFILCSLDGSMSTYCFIRVFVYYFQNRWSYSKKFSIIQFKS